MYLCIYVSRYLGIYVSTWYVCMYVCMYTHTINIYTKSFGLSRASISDPCSPVAVALFFCDFSVPWPLLALVLAARGSPW